MLKDHEDAYGHMIYDYFESKGTLEISEIVEREDGFIDASKLGPKAYFSKYKDLPSHQKKAMKFVSGKILDIGCGAGRHSLYLQKRGFEVIGIDLSPLAIKVCKMRGLKKAKVQAVTKVSPRLGTFDTLLMLGNNFGLFSNSKRAKWLLKRFYNITTKNGRIIAETRDIYQTKNPDHLGYHQRNRKRGRMPGQVRIRVRYKKCATPWFDYLMVSKEEMRKLLKDSNWGVKRLLNGEDGIYIAVIEKIR